MANSASRNSFPKFLQGPATVPAGMLSSLQDSIIGAIEAGPLTLNNINITSGTIDGTVQGSNNAGPVYTTTLQSGNPQGVGYQVCFYGTHVGDSCCYEPIISQWNIQGQLLVRDTSDLGNIRIFINTIESTNTNGPIIIAPNGIGIITLDGPVTQTTSLGNITFNTTNGLYSLNASKTIMNTSGTNTSFYTQNGDIILQTGLNIPTLTINFITTGLTPTITTTTVHNLSVNDVVTLSNTNCTPTINGNFTVTNIVSTTSFKINVLTSVTGSGTSGNVSRHDNIFLTATNNVEIPVNVGLTFGGSTQQIIADVSSNLTISAGNNINLNAVETVINGNLLVTGVATYIESNIVEYTDPILIIGGQTPPILNDGKDLGIEFRWNDNSGPLLGFFGWDVSSQCFTVIPRATDVNQVVTGTRGDVCFGVGNFTTVNATSLNVTNIVATTVTSSLNTCSIFCNSTMNITATNNINLNATQTIINGTLNTCDIQCSGALNITASSGINLNSSNLSTTSKIITINSVVPGSDDLINKGIQFNYYNGGAQTGFFGYLDSSQCFTFLSSVSPPTKGNVCLGNTTVNNLNVTGTVTGIQTTLSTEHLTAAGGGVINPSNNINITFIKVTSSGVVTGTLGAPTTDGYQKHIMISGLVSGASYVLTASTGILMDPGSGSTAQKSLTFASPGQSIGLIWNNVDGYYIFIQGGVCIS